jgi:hypothetical protein
MKFVHVIKYVKYALRINYTCNSFCLNNLKLPNKIDVVYNIFGFYIKSF